MQSVTSSQCVQATPQMDFDLDLAISQSNENPVYYAQYAHARISSILRQADEKWNGCTVENVFIGKLKKNWNY